MSKVIEIKEIDGKKVEIRANPNCPICNGTGKMIILNPKTTREVVKACRCKKYRVIKKV